MDPQLDLTGVLLIEQKVLERKNWGLDQGSTLSLRKLEKL